MFFHFFRSYYTQVCNFCCKFIDDPDVQKQVLLPKFFGEKKLLFVSDSLMTCLEAGPKTYFENASIEEKNHEMILALTTKLASQKGALKYSTACEHQNNVKKKYFTIDELIQHPICRSYLMRFCQSQHNSENLAFLADVDEYREIFSDDNEICLMNWKLIDTKVSIDEDDIDDRYLIHPWTLKANKAKALDKINNILNKYFHSDSSTQVCISNSIIDKTSKRIKLLSLYGASVFEEACIDPMMTMEKDILPRFRVSNCIKEMIINVSLCEPPPPAADLEVCPPGNILLHISSLDSFDEMRRFSLEEVIGTHNLFIGFFQYLQMEKSEGMNKLICIRYIDIFQELMDINCHHEALKLLWTIFRYFVVPESVYQIKFQCSALKKLLLQSANPRKDIFQYFRVAVLDLLRLDFEVFMKTSVYQGYSNMMKELKLNIGSKDKCVVLTSLNWLRCDK